MTRVLRKTMVLMGLLLTIGLVSGIYGLQKHPEWLLNSYSVRWASDHVLRPLGVDLRFGQLDLSFGRKTFWQRSLRLKTQNFSLRFADFELIIPSLDGLLWVNLHPKNFAIEAIGPLEAKGLQFHGKMSAEQPASIDASLDPPQADSSAFWQSIRWQGPITLELAHVRWEQGTTLWEGGKLGLKLETRDEHMFALDLSAQDHKALVDGTRLSLPSLAAQTAFSWDGKIFKPLRLGPITASQIQLDIKPSQVPEASEDKSFDWQTWLKHLETIEVAPISLDIAQLRYEESKSISYQGRLSLQASRTSPADWTLELKGKDFRGLPLRDLSLVIRSSLPDTTLQNWSTQWQGFANLDAKGRLSMQGSLQKEGKSYRSKLTSHVELGAKKADLTAEARLTGQDYLLHISGSGRALLDSLPTIHVPHCRWQGKWLGEPLQSVDSQMSCSLRIERALLANEDKFPLLLPKSQELNIEGPLRVTEITKSPRLSAELQARMPEWKSGVLRAKGELHAALQGPLKDFKSQGKIHFDGGAQLSIDSFQALVSVLKHSQWEVPAPFHTLDGPLSCKASARIDLQQERYEAPLQCHVQLASPSQSFRWTAEGQLSSREKQKPLLGLRVNLEQIQLELPKLVLGEPLPQILADKRFTSISAVAPDPAESPIDWDIHIVTPEASPMRFVSHLLKEPVPIRIDLVAKSNPVGVSGNVALQNYRLDIMKKKALVESVGLRLSADAESPQLYGLLRFEDADTKINLKLSGTVDRPFYILESQPPRPSTELLSMILFGGNPDAMSDDNLRSVEQTRAAMIDGAIGLVSMFYLASTPIDSVGYNPYTGVFRARVQLSQGTSLFVGSDLEGAKQSIGLRRRLTENWSFETGAETSEANGKNKGLAMFKWGRRY